MSKLQSTRTTVTAETTTTTTLDTCFVLGTWYKIHHAVVLFQYELMLDVDFSQEINSSFLGHIAMYTGTCTQVPTFLRRFLPAHSRQH